LAVTVVVTEPSAADCTVLTSAYFELASLRNWTTTGAANPARSGSDSPASRTARSRMPVSVSVSPGATVSGVARKWSPDDGRPSNVVPRLTSIVEARVMVRVGACRSPRKALNVIWFGPTSPSDTNGSRAVPSGIHWNREPGNCQKFARISQP
jgi:hypothetical protein